MFFGSIAFISVKASPVPGVLIKLIKLRFLAQDEIVLAFAVAVFTMGSWPDFTPLKLWRDSDRGLAVLSNVPVDLQAESSAEEKA